MFFDKCSFTLYESVNKQNCLRIWATKRAERYPGYCNAQTQLWCRVPLLKKGWLGVILLKWGVSLGRANKSFSTTFSLFRFGITPMTRYFSRMTVSFSLLFLWASNYKNDSKALELTVVVRSRDHQALQTWPCATSFSGAIKKTLNLPTFLLLILSRRENYGLILFVIMDKLFETSWETWHLVCAYFSAKKRLMLELF